MQATSPAPFRPAQRTRALVVDDDPVIRGLMPSQLAHLVDDVVVASDGVEAWRLLLGEGFHLAICDLMMPGLDGFGLISCIRGHKRTRHMPIVVVSSSNDRRSIERALEAGANAFLTKPLTWSLFNTHISHLIRTSSAAERSAVGLARLKACQAAQAELTEAIASIALSILPQSHEAPIVAPRGPDPHALRLLIEQLHALHCELASADVVEGPMHSLDGLARAACAHMSDQLEAMGRTVDRIGIDGIELGCRRSAMTAALAAILAMMSSRAPQGTRITLEAIAQPEHFALRICVPRLSGWSPPSELTLSAADVANGATSRRGVDLSFALARLAIAAHGGSMALLSAPQSPGIEIRMPLDRVRIPTLLTVQTAALPDAGAA